MESSSGKTEELFLAVNYKEISHVGSYRRYAVM